MMPDVTPLVAWGLPGLFLAAVVGGSFLPIPSEAVLAALVYKGVPWGPAVLVATVGNVLGAFILYSLGRRVARGRGGALGRWVERQRLQKGARAERARVRLATWGAPVLVLAWVPVVGEVLALTAGLMGVHWASFLVFVTLGKGLRYLVIALSVAAASHTG